MATFYRNDLWAHYSSNIKSYYYPIVLWKDEVGYIEYDGDLVQYNDQWLNDNLGLFMALIPEPFLPLCAKSFSEDNELEKIDYMGYGDIFNTNGETTYIKHSW